MAPERFETKIDAMPEFWQFLNGLLPQDLIAELVQNDLDAGASRTRIVFEKDRFTCEGDGAPVDAVGWKRLSYIRGAGDEVPRKSRRIGVKNHGLKTCFTLGDELSLSSAGRLIKQTLYCHGRNNPPRPGAFVEPVEHTAAPTNGCRIEVPYRTKPLTAPVGECLVFSVPSTDAIELLFRTGCQEIPERFIGAIRPDSRKTYALELSHYRLGSVRFSFRCRVSKRAVGGTLFSRICEVGGDQKTEGKTLRETAFCFPLRPESPPATEIPSFYGSSKRILLEIAWAATTKGEPLPTKGRRRYPITYTGSGEAAHTGLAVHYSAPFVSDLERHGASVAAADWNDSLMRACDDALVNLLRDYLVPNFGPRALRLLIAPNGSSSTRLLELTNALIAARAIPLASAKRKPLRFGPREEQGGALRRVILPILSWEEQKVSPLLAKMCPDELDQIHPQVPSEILKLMCSGELEGWEHSHVDFDEDDALDRIQPTHETAYFPWASQVEWKNTLSQPKYAVCGLDLLLEVFEHARPNDTIIANLRAHVLLPDQQGALCPLGELFTGSDLPEAVAAVGLPSLLHPTLRSHPLFQRRAWKPKRYTLETFFSWPDLASMAEDQRHALWEWLRENTGKIPFKSRRRIVNLLLWPDTTGALRCLDELCEPRDVIGKALADVLKRPDRRLAKLPVFRRNVGTFRLRRIPNEGELDRFYTRRSNAIPKARSLTEPEIAELRRFESELAALTTETAIARWLRKQENFALNREATIQLSTQLLRPTHRTARLFLHPTDLLDRPERSLDNVFPPCPEPSAEAILRALSADPSRTDALVLRLQALQSAARREHIDVVPRLAALPVIPCEEGILPPSQLVFKGARDYWGAWKRVLPTGLTAGDVQELYRFAGVMRSDPTRDTSLAFFRWLGAQPRSIIIAHVAQALRQINHSNGVVAWWEDEPELPCIPVQVGSEVRMVGHCALAKHRVFLPDFKELEDVIRTDEPNERVMLAIVSHKDVTTPISDRLIAAGAQSLRHSAATPIAVVGEDELEASADIVRIVADLRSAKLRDLRKRLSELQVPVRVLREQWRSRLEEIQRVKSAARVIAAFKLGRRTYHVNVACGFDTKSGILWLRRESDAEKMREALYDAIAQRVFVEGTERYFSIVLQKAIRHEARDSFQFIPASEDSSADEEPEPSEDNTPTETFPTHRASDFDPTINLPDPTPLSLNSNTHPGNPGSGSGSGKKRRTTQSRFTPEIEAEHREQLKRNHYAWHCQMCLADSQPIALAPRGSYVEWQENRHRFIEGHHPDQVHADGSRHGGNLLVLCHRHHYLIGNSLTRQEVERALRGNAKPRRVVFLAGENGRDGRKEVHGNVVKLKIQTLGKSIAIFFTDAHREFWLQS